MAITPSQLAYLPFKDSQALLDWAGLHADLHRRVAQKAIQDGHTNLGTYDVADMVDMDDFNYFHNAEHEDIASTYNLQTPPDLSFWDQENQVNFDNWLQAHALVHQDIINGLNL